MSASVRISARSARLIEAVLVVLEEQGSLHAYEKQALEEIRTARRPKPSRRISRERRTAKKTAKNAQTAEIRAAVFERARQGVVVDHPVCELCHFWRATDLHHSFGRVRVPQSVTNTVAICRKCHDRLTRNEPSAAHWQKEQLRHFEGQGFTDEAARMRALLEAEREIKQAADISRNLLEGRP